MAQTAEIYPDGKQDPACQAACNAMYSYKFITPFFFLISIVAVTVETLELT